MLYLQETLKRLAEEELQRRDIIGEVVGVRLMSNKGCAMIRIGFISEIAPTPVLTEFDYLEKWDDEYYLFTPIDTSIYVK